MTSRPTRIQRADWAALLGEFERFFSGLGSVTVSEDEAEFVAGFTGLALQRDGSSRSFMPLHNLEAAWSEVEFDYDQHLVTLRSEGTRYEYRVPPNLLE